MSQPVALRNRFDRIRYAVSFELVLLMLVAPLGAMAFDLQVVEMGAFSIVASLLAMAISVSYNSLFDKIDARAGRVSSDRGWRSRILHAAGFELIIALAELPLLVFWLGLSIGDAVVADLALAGFVVLFTYVFTLTYDRVFPVR